MALPFIPSDAGLLIMQAGVVLAPRAVNQDAAIHRWLSRFRSPAWALIPVGSIVGVIFAIRYASQTANWLAELALLAVPILAAVALGWTSRGSRPYLAVLAIGLFLLAWRSNASLAGEAAASILSALSCVTLGVLLGAVTPTKWLKLGILAMAAADVWLVGTDLLQKPNSILVGAVSRAGLPQLQSETFGTVNMGYGDMFVAALLGASFARQPRVQRTAALLTLVFAALFDLLFIVINELPATVPVALALVTVQIGLARRGSSRHTRRRSRAADRLASAGIAAPGSGARPSLSSAEPALGSAPTKPQ
ncbi:MAG TPA: hypothetical protein VFP55_08545 [Solirubrobacteraceae bacterium]|nr:hypothetical protein [Solirubrobacteraceae bacterium]